MSCNRIVPVRFSCVFLYGHSGGIIFRSVFLLALFVLTSGCKRNPVQQSGGLEKTADVSKEAQVFVLPAIPMTLTDPDKRLEYLVFHFWDNLNWTDTVRGRQSGEAERFFADYLNLLSRTSPQIVNASVNRTLERILPKQAVFDWFTEMFDKYLYDPNSPLRDEELYAQVLSRIIANEKIDEIYKIRPLFQLEQINKNRLGAEAADFFYILSDGSRGRLHEITAEYTLLFFYNPDCPDCKRTQYILQHSEKLAGLLAAGRMRVLALYPDKDMALWNACQATFPAEWLNARDASAKSEIKNELYAIRAIPSLYLLDKKKRVILKDATAEQLIAALEQGF